MTTRTITVTPNFDGIFDRFLYDSKLHLSNLSREHQTHGLTHIFSRKEVYDFVASLRIALGAMTKVEQVEKLRDMFDEQGDKMHKVLLKEQAAQDALEESEYENQNG